MRKNRNKKIVMRKNRNQQIEVSQFSYPKAIAKTKKLIRAKTAQINELEHERKLLLNNMRWFYDNKERPESAYEAKGYDYCCGWGFAVNDWHNDFSYNNKDLAKGYRNLGTLNNTLRNYIKRNKPELRYKDEKKDKE